MTEETEVVVDEAPEVVEQPETPEALPKQEEASQYGWKPLEEYIAEGGDPDTYKGAKAFLKDYKVRQDRNRYKGDVDDLKQSIEKLTLGFSHIQEKERAKHLASLEAAKKKAKEEFDMDAYDNAQQQIDNIKTQPQQVPVNQGEPELVKRFRLNNPVLDSTDDSFDAPLNELVEARVNKRLYAHITQKNQPPSEQFFQEVMEKELRQAQLDLGRGRQARKAPAVNAPNKKAQKGNPISKLDPMEKDLYETLKKTSKGAAENFLKSISEGR